MKKSTPTEPYTLVLVEGDTEEIFYRCLKTKFFQRCPSLNINLGGNWNINKKVLDEASRYLGDNPLRIFRIFIAIDTDSRSGKAPIDMKYIQNELRAFSNIKTDDVILFEAVQDIESWFFHDIEGIFEFLRLPLKNRNPSKFRPVEKLNHRDLSRLFKQGGKEYRKGNASTHFIEQLNLDLIRKGSSILNRFCSMMEEYS